MSGTESGSEKPGAAKESEKPSALEIGDELEEIVTWLIQHPPNERPGLRNRKYRRLQTLVRALGVDPDESDFWEQALSKVAAAREQAGEAREARTVPQPPPDSVQ